MKTSMDLLGFPSAPELFDHPVSGTDLLSSLPTLNVSPVFPSGTIGSGQGTHHHATPAVMKEPIINAETSTGSPTHPTPASWALVEGFVAEDTVLATARERSAEVGIDPVSPGVGAALQFLAGVLGARTAVEIGTGTGVSGLWILRGMPAGGVLTTVDIEAEHQRLAKESFREAQIPSQRVRTISGSALDVLPRLTDSHYDLVFCDGDPREYPAYLDEAIRLLRPGGVVVFDNALLGGKVADPAVRDQATVAVRALGRAVAEHESLVPLLLPLGDGLLAARLAS